MSRAGPVSKEAAPKGSGRGKVLVAYASKAGSTKGIAEFICEKLKQRGVEANVADVGQVREIGEYDAYVVGSAVYNYHWLKEAREFVSKNRSILSTRPVWIFSSGPTGTKLTDSKGRDLREVDKPKELDELRGWINPRDHQIFFGAFFPDRLKGGLGFFAKMAPKDEVGDFRNWEEIGAWANSITQELAMLKQGASIPG